MTRAARARGRIEAARSLWTGQVGAAYAAGCSLTARRSRVIRAATLGLLLALGACNSGDSGPPVPIGELPRLLADALCGNIGPCCQEAGFAFDAAQCRAAAEAELRQNVDEYSMLQVSYDAAAARACVDAYARYAQACVDTSEVLSGCGLVFTGTLTDGAVCTQSAECISRSCPSVPDGGVRQCTTSSSGSRIHGKLGEACGWTCTTNGSSTSCSGSGNTSGPGCYTNEGLYCDAAHVCATVPMLGQACTSGAACAGEAFCEGNVCVAKRTSGSCATSSTACASSAYCDSTTRQCLPRKASGETCTTHSECQSTDRCTTGTCRRRTIATENMCSGNL